MTTGTREHAVGLAGGASTTLEQWGDAGPVILCVHGITSSRRSWGRLGERLQSRFRTFAYDQRGHGDSAAAAGPMTLAQSVSDLEAVTAALPAPVDLLIGHSWGGAVAILGGRAIGAKKVLAIDPMVRVLPHTFDADYVDDLRETLALPPAQKEAAVRDMYAGAHPDDVAAKVHAMVPMSIRALESLGRDNRADEGAWDLREAIAAYPVPLLLLVAGDDSVMSEDDLAFVRERGGPNASVRVFAGEGHNLHRTAFEAFADAVEAFA